MRVAANATEALARVAERAPDLVLTDVRMPGDSGVDLLKLLRERAPDTDVALMTAYEDMTTIVTAMREGAVDFIVKPIALDALHELVDRVFEDRSTRRKASRGRDDPAAYARVLTE